MAFCPLGESTGRAEDESEPFPDAERRDEYLSPQQGLRIREEESGTQLGRPASPSSSKSCRHHAVWPCLGKVRIASVYIS